MKKLTPEQLERLKPEVREKYKKDLKRAVRNRKILAAVIGLVVIAGLCLGLSMTVLFNISSIKVAKKSNYYSEKEIISASGLDIGDNMLRTDFESAAQRIEKMLPYVLDAQIKKNASGNITITVKDDKATIVFESANGFAVADSDGKVLEILSSEPEEGTFIYLKTSQKAKAVPGESIGFEDSSEADIYSRLVTALKDTGIFEKISGIDISKHANLKVEYEGRIRIKLGDISDIDSKLEAASKTLEMENENNPGTVAEINATNPKKIYVNPLESLDDVIGGKRGKRMHEEETTSADGSEETSDEDGETEEKSESGSEDETYSEETENENTEEDDEENTDEEEGNAEEENENDE